jgi:DNA-binding NtrC family response regulator
VLTARNGEEALRIYRDRAREVDLVLLDLTMPVMGGRECFQKMRGVDPKVRVVVSSGFSSDSTASEVLKDGAVAYVSKPYDIDALARVIRKALETDPAPPAHPAAGPSPAPAAAERRRRRAAAEAAYPKRTRSRGRSRPPYFGGVRHARSGDRHAQAEGVPSDRDDRAGLKKTS